MTPLKFKATPVGLTVMLGLVVLRPTPALAQSPASANLLGIYGFSVAWGDYGKDGDLDILMR